MKEIILDANAILRYMLNDIPEQADITEKMLLTRDVVILPEVIAEVVYVLLKYYGYSRKEAERDILEFLIDAECSDSILVTALNAFGDKGLDFVDCLLYAYSARYDILTFDKDLRKLIDKGGKS